MVGALTSLLGVGLVSLPSTTLGPAGGPSVTLPRLPDPGQIDSRYLRIYARYIYTRYIYTRYIYSLPTRGAGHAAEAVLGLHRVFPPLLLGLGPEAEVLRRLAIAETCSQMALVR